MKKILFLIILFPTMLFAQYEPEEYERTVDWHTFVYNLEYLGVDTFKFDVAPLNLNEPGAGQKYKGNFFMDYVHYVFPIIDSTETTITVIDPRGKNTAPQINKFGKVFNTVNDRDTIFYSIGQLDDGWLDKNSTWRLSKNWEIMSRVVDRKLENPVEYIEYQPQDPALPFQPYTTWYNEEKHAISTYTENLNVQLDNGEELWTPLVINDNGSEIPDGYPVYSTGDQGGIMTVEKASNDTYEESRAIGLATLNIAINDTGRITRFGDVNLDLTGSGLATGLVYLDQTAPIGLSNTEPMGGKYSCFIGRCLRTGTNGRIFVMPYVSERTAEQNDETGWPEAVGSIIAFNNTTRYATIYPTVTDFYHYQDGIKFTSTGDSVLIPDEDGQYLTYYDDGVYSYIKNPSDFQLEPLMRTKSLVNWINYDADNNEAIFFEDERHKRAGYYPRLLHLLIHFAPNLGTQYITGLALQDFDIDGTGNDDTNAQFGVESGIIADEDLSKIINAYPVPATIPVYYREGTNGYWRKGETTGFSQLNAPAGRMYWNEWTGTTWQLTEMTNGYRAPILIYATGGVTNKIAAVMSQNEYASDEEAIVAALKGEGSLNDVGQFPFTESRLIGVVLAQTRSNYSNSVQTRFISFDVAGVTSDYYDTRLLGGGSGGTGGSGSAVVAADVFYDNLVSGLLATNVQDAIDEVVDSTLSNVDNGYLPVKRTGYENSVIYQNATDDLLNIDGAILSEGIYGAGWVESNLGTGTRMMWYPRKAAFRAGKVAGTEWDDANIGDQSFAAGKDVSVPGNNSAGFGNLTSVPGNISVGFGRLTYVPGVGSLGAGFSCTISGDQAFGTGNNILVSGDYAMGAGFFLKSEARSNNAFGQYNVGGGNSTTWVETDPLFELGNGTSDSNRKNAVTIYKNGNSYFEKSMGIGYEPIDNISLYVQKDTTNSQVFVQGGYVDMVGASTDASASTSSIVSTTSVATIGASNTANWPSDIHPRVQAFDGVIQTQAGSSGTIDQVAVYYGSIANNTGSAQILNGYIGDFGFQYSNSILDKAIGLRIEDLQSGVNHATGIFLNDEAESNPPDGRWAIYDSTGYESYLHKINSTAFVKEGSNGDSILLGDGTTRFDSTTILAGLIEDIETDLSGTANYIPKFSGSGINESVIYQNGTDIGVGTTLPSSELELRSADNNPTFAIVSGTSNNSTIKLGDYDDDDRGYIQYQNSSDKMIFGTNASQAIVIDNGQNVGIDKTPTVKLDVNGQVNATNLNLSAIGSGISTTIVSLDGSGNATDDLTKFAAEVANNAITGLTGEVVASGPGSASTVIANGVVDEANLKALNIPTDGDLLAYEQGSLGFEWFSPAELGIIPSLATDSFLVMFADDTLKNTVIYQDNNGMIGINTVEPLTEVHLYKDQDSPTTLTVQNPSNGTAARSQLIIGNTANQSPFSDMYFTTYGTNYTESGLRKPNSSAIIAGGGLTNGLSIGTNGEAPLRLFTSGVGNTETVLIQNSKMTVYDTIDVIGAYLLNGVELETISSATAPLDLTSGVLSLDVGSLAEAQPTLDTDMLLWYDVSAGDYKKIRPSSILGAQYYETPVYTTTSVTVENGYGSNDFTIGSSTITSAGLMSAADKIALDNAYLSWGLYSDGVLRSPILDGEKVNFVGGTNISLAYSTTLDNTITINSTGGGYWTESTNLYYEDNPVSIGNTGNSLGGELQVYNSATQYALSVNQTNSSSIGVGIVSSGQGMYISSATTGIQVQANATYYGLNCTGGKGINIASGDAYYVNGTAGVTSSGTVDIADIESIKIEGGIITELNLF